MSNQIPVLYTEQKTKKVKIWLDGYLVPRPTLNSARLISAGKHEIDVVFYSSIEDIQPGREFETDRYLISVEESISDNQSRPKPSFFVNDPTMKNKPKSTPFVPPRLVPKAEPPPTPPSIPSMSTFERHNPHQWGYAGMTTAMKRSAYDDDNDDDRFNHVSKITKPSHFIPPAFHKRESIQTEELPQQPVSSSSTVPIQPIPGLLNDSVISRLLNKSRPEEIKSSSVKQTPSISWSTWDEKKSDDEDSNPLPTLHDENSRQPIPSTKQTSNWHSLVTSAGQTRQIDHQSKTLETMPKFDFDDSSFDTLFDNLDE